MSDSAKDYKLDKKDRQILSLLQKQGRIAISDLADAVNLSDTPCLRRVRKLEQAGFIEGYHATLSARALNLNVLVYALIRLNKNSASAADAFEQSVSELPQVLECSVITGSYDYLLKIIAEDLAGYEQFVKQSLGHIDTIADIESTVVLKQTFARNQLPI